MHRSSGRCESGRGYHTPLLYSHTRTWADCILVNNAGTTRDKLIIQMSTADFEHVIDSNLRSTFLCTRAALRPMMKARWGRIVNITSIAGLLGSAGQANYSAS